MDKREAILVRLVEIAGELTGIKTAVRNQDEISERTRPAIAIFDADETADERANEQGHGGRAPNIVEMSPEALILLGGTPERVGTDLNEMRAKFVKAVLIDTQLATLDCPSWRRPIASLDCVTDDGSTKCSIWSGGERYAVRIRSRC